MPLIVSNCSLLHPSPTDIVFGSSYSQRSPSPFSDTLESLMDNFTYYGEPSGQHRASKGFSATQGDDESTWGYFQPSAGSPSNASLSIPQQPIQRRTREDRLWSPQHGHPYMTAGRQTHSPYLSSPGSNPLMNSGPHPQWPHQEPMITRPDDHNVLVLTPDSASPSVGERSFSNWEFGESTGFPSPSSVGSPNEFFLDFDYPQTLSAENLSLSSDGLLAPPSTSPKLSSSAPSSCLSTPSYRNTQLSEPSETTPRDMSPSGSTDDPQNSRRRFPCIVPGCTRRFTSQYTLKVHVEAHKPKPRVTFPCTLGCSERFSRQHDRLRHEVAKHGKVCEFSCQECGRFFSSQKTLGNHKCPVAQGGTRWVN